MTLAKEMRKHSTHGSSLEREKLESIWWNSQASYQKSSAQVTQTFLISVFLFEVA